MTVKFYLEPTDYIHIYTDKHYVDYNIIRMEGVFVTEEVVFNGATSYNITSFITDDGSRKVNAGHMLFDTWEEAFQQRGRWLASSRKTAGKWAVLLDKGLTRPLTPEPTDAISPIP